MVTDQWDCPLCGTEGNESESCMKCGAELISSYTDQEAIEDGILVDLASISPGRCLVRSPKGPLINRCTSAVFHAFTKKCEDGSYDTDHLWDAALASTQREDDGWFKGELDNKRLWLVP